jgi:hypothetical protein
MGVDMQITLRACALILVSLGLGGCALPRVRSLTQEEAAPFQPIDVVVVVDHPELYGAFDTMKITPRESNPCLPRIEPGAMPEVNWDCGGLTDMIAAKLSASRARKAEEAVRPVRSELADLDIAALLSESLARSLQALPNVKVASWRLMKKPSGSAAEDVYRASTANAVLFIRLDHYLSADFSAFEISTDSQLFARSLAARNAAGLNNVPAGSADALPALVPTNAVYRSTVIYHADLPRQTDDSLAGHAATWRADRARLIRAAVEDGRVQLPPLLAEEFQRPNTARRTVVRKVREQGTTMDLVAEKDGRQWLVTPQGTLYYKTQVPAVARTAAQ